MGFVKKCFGAVAFVCGCVGIPATAQVSFDGVDQGADVVVDTVIDAEARVSGVGTLEVVDGGQLDSFFSSSGGSVVLNGGIIQDPADPPAGLSASSQGQGSLQGFSDDSRTTLIMNGGEIRGNDAISSSLPSEAGLHLLGRTGLTVNAGLVRGGNSSGSISGPSSALVLNGVNSTLNIEAVINGGQFIAGTESLSSGPSAPQAVSSGGDVILTINDGFFQGGAGPSELSDGSALLINGRADNGSINVTNFNGGVFRSGVPGQTSTGFFGDSVIVIGGAELNIRGGDFDGILALSSTLNIYGTAFELDGNPLVFASETVLTLDEEGGGVLAVDYLGGAFDDIVFRNSDSSTINLILVPEPATGGLVLAAVVAGLSRRRPIG